MKPIAGVQDARQMRLKQYCGFLRRENLTCTNTITRPILRIYLFTGKNQVINFSKFLFAPLQIKLYGV